jgi:hypothetical protein
VDLTVAPFGPAENDNQSIQILFQRRPVPDSRILAPGLRLVHEGFDTRDLKEAKALLDELAS